MHLLLSKSVVSFLLGQADVLRLLHVYVHLQSELFLLVTDQGFLSEKNVVWETLNNVEGDGYFVDAQFHTYTKPTPLAEPLVPPAGPPGSEEQVDQEYVFRIQCEVFRCFTKFLVRLKCESETPSMGYNTRVTIKTCGPLVNFAQK